MKTCKSGILILSALLLFSCGTNKQKEKENTDKIYAMVDMAQMAPIEESNIISEDMSENKNALHFVPPAICTDEEIRECEMQISVADTGFDRLNDEEYSQFAENKFQRAKDEPLSTFSVDVDAASYSNMRRFINRGTLPEKDAVRIEELINYFSYNYPEPTGSDPVKISAEVGNCPWNNQNRLVKIGLKARNIAGDNLPASNFVFLIDVSGSMEGPTRLGLVKSSLKLLVNNLREKDRVAIVVYAGAAGEVLSSTSGSNKQKIKEALENLSAGGSTAGGAGIQLAYKIAKKNFIKGGNNRIILCTDGDFNVGVSSDDGLQKLIEQERKSGVFLSILGYGMGNYKDKKMQVLAQTGNGNHAYIDNLQEANKVLVNEFGATMYTVAKDVKLQVEFNPAKVQA
ncbi:MAG: VWA domain-containing protein, partial [Prevotella sp.]|nr:VWA domain-containing protein [Prevotella sp.]